MAAQLTLQAPQSLPPNELRDHLERLWNTGLEGSRGAATITLVIYEASWLQQQLIRTGLLDGPINGLLDRGLIERAKAAVSSCGLPLSTAVMDQRLAWALGQRPGDHRADDLRGQFVDVTGTTTGKGFAGEIRYRRHDEGHHFTELTAAVPDAEARNRCTFEQGDALNLRGDLGEFDRVHAANLLCRLNRPVELLKQLPSLVRPGGELVLATPCTWLGEFTPPEQWPDGSTAEWLEENLQNHFSLVKSIHEPFLIRETARKFQWSSSLVTVWEKIS